MNANPNSFTTAELEVARTLLARMGFTPEQLRGVERDNALRLFPRFTGAGWRPAAHGGADRRGDPQNLETRLR